MIVIFSACPLFFCPCFRCATSLACGSSRTDGAAWAPTQRTAVCGSLPLYRKGSTSAPCRCGMVDVGVGSSYVALVAIVNGRCSTCDFLTSLFRTCFCPLRLLLFFSYVSLYTWPNAYSSHPEKPCSLRHLRGVNCSQGEAASSPFAGTCCGEWSTAAWATGAPRESKSQKQRNKKGTNNESI